MSTEENKFMVSLFPLVSDILHRVEPPYRGFIVDIVEYKPDVFSYRLYRENIEEFSDPQKLSLFEWIDERLKAAQVFLVNATVGLEIEDKVPPLKENNNG